METASEFWGKEVFALQLQVKSLGRYHECETIYEIWWLWIWNTILTSSESKVSPTEEKGEQNRYSGSNLISFHIIIEATTVRSWHLEGSQQMSWMYFQTWSNTVTEISQNHGKMFAEKGRRRVLQATKNSERGHHLWFFPISTEVNSSDVPSAAISSGNSLFLVQNSHWYHGEHHTKLWKKNPGLTETKRNLDKAFKEG